MDLNEVDAHLDDIADMYDNVSYLQRMRNLYYGMKQPRETKEYKEAMIEMQRLSAPISAVLLPILAIVVLIFMSAVSVSDDRIIETQIMEAEEMKELEEPEKLIEPPDEIVEMDVDVPIDTPDVNVETTEDTDMSPKPVEFDAVMNVKSPVVLKNIFGSSRNTGVRGTLLARHGGDPATERAVMRALRWLKKNQNSDGSWNKQKCAMTGLAVLTFLAHNEKPGSSPEFGETVRKALDYLMNGQNKNTGLFGNMDGHQYAHPIAAYAMCEAYGMTRNPNTKESALLAMGPIINGQNSSGGWTYKMDGTSSRSDTSYMGWCAQALKASKLAGIHADGLDEAIKRAIKGFLKNASPSGGFGYTSPARKGLTSVGTLCMQLLGASSDPAVQNSLSLMDEWAIGQYDGKNSVGGNPQYYFYYATQAKFHDGGQRWKSWNAMMKPIYIGAQKIEKKAIKDHKGTLRDIGWWENGDKHSDRPVMDTCLTALQLMVYYRYLPTTSVASVQVEAEVEATATDTGDITVDVGNL